MNDNFIAVDEARNAILSDLRLLGSERVATLAAVGRRLAESIDAPWDAPSFDNSAMDGFGFRFDDREIPLRVVGVSAAGTPFDGEVNPGEAIRIMTGAAVPVGVDTVAMREICLVEGEMLKIDGSQVSSIGQHIREQGCYMHAGSPVLPAGTLVRPAGAGLLASFGRTVVYVRRAPRVAVVTTGSELVEPDRALGAGQIHNSNAFMLEALLRAAGADPFVAPIVPDNEQATREAIRDVAATADMVLTVGGVSVGDYDFVREVLEELTGGMTFWKVRMKPGKPLAFGCLPAGTPVIGLPGNPGSSFVAFHQFVRPALDRLQGAAEGAPRRLKLKTQVAIRSTPKRCEFVPGHLVGGGDLLFSPHDQSSGNVLSLHDADALGIIPEGVNHVPAGGWLDVQPL